MPDGAFEATAPSFDNPDVVATVVHSYRYRYGLAPGDPAHAADELVVAAQPPITVPTVVIDATADPLDDPQPLQVPRQHFTDLVERRLVDAGHDVPPEAPAAFAATVRLVRARTT